MRKKYLQKYPITILQNYFNMSQSKVKKNKLDQYSDAIKTFASGLKVYQKLTEFKVKKFGFEILELAEQGKLSVKDTSKIKNKIQYEATVTEWQFIDHVQTLNKNLTQYIIAGAEIDINVVFENYKKWVKDFLEVQCKTNPSQYRIVSLDDYRKFLDEKRAQKNKESEQIESKKIKTGFIGRLFHKQL